MQACGPATTFLRERLQTTTSSKCLGCCVPQAAGNAVNKTAELVRNQSYGSPEMLFFNYLSAVRVDEPIAPETMFLSSLRAVKPWRTREVQSNGEESIPDLPPNLSDITN